MGSEVKREPVLANFRARGAKKPHKNSERYKKRPGMSEKHLVLVRSCPCAACGRMPAGTVHHLKSGTGERGAGLRSTDKWGVPLCMMHHEEVERAGTKQEVATFSQWSIDPHQLAQGLWAAKGDLKRMMRVVLAHREAGNKRA